MKCSFISDTYSHFFQTNTTRLLKSFLYEPTVWDNILSNGYLMFFNTICPISIRQSVYLSPFKVLIVQLEVQIDHSWTKCPANVLAGGENAGKAKFLEPCLALRGQDRKWPAPPPLYPPPHPLILECRPSWWICLV